MKIYLSADMEGITGVAHWDETFKDKSDYQEFREQMTLEVAAACEGAIRAGASEILVKDAHDSGRNLIAAKLPEQTKLIREWSGHPLEMVQEIDDSFDSAIFIGYHSAAGQDTSPLAHTMSGDVDYLKINGTLVSEFLLNAYAAAVRGVPVVFVSGDEGVCRLAASLNDEIHTVAVKQGIGRSVVSIHPQLAIRKIKEGVESALKTDRARFKITLPDRFDVEIRFKKPAKAYKGSFYPGARCPVPQVVTFESNDYFDVLRMLMFVL